MKKQLIAAERWDKINYNIGGEEMKLTIGETTLNIQGLTEQRTPTGWIAAMSSTTAISSIALEDLLTKQTPSELVFSNDADEVIATLTGYTQLSGLTVRHLENGQVSEITITRPLPTSV